MAKGYDLEVGGVEFFGQHAERLWVLAEVADVEDGLRVWQVVLLEGVIETSPRTAEVWDPGSCIGGMCVCVCVCVEIGYI